MNTLSGNLAPQGAKGLDEAASSGKTFVGDDWQALVSHPKIKIVTPTT